MDEAARDTFFRQLYGEYQRAIFAYLLSHVNDRETARDLLQETFLRAWNGLDAGHAMGLEKARYWLYRIARNLLTDHYRRQSVRKQAQEHLRDEASRDSARAASAEAVFEASDKLRRIELAVAALPEEQRRVLVLHLVGGLNSQEIGELLEVPAGTVRYRLSMARKALRLQDVLAEEQEEVSRS